MEGRPLLNWYSSCKQMALHLPVPGSHPQWCLIGSVIGSMIDHPNVISLSKSEREVLALITPHTLLIN